MTGKTKKQHYVPQFYLRKFAIEGHNKLYSFDKFNCVSRQQEIKNVASENYFYDHNLNDLINKMDDEKKDEFLKQFEENDLEFLQIQYLEKIFSNIEGKFADTIQSILKKAEMA